MPRKRNAIPPKFKITVLSEKGKPVKNPTRGQLVYLAAVGPKGGIYKLNKTPQRYFKTDAKALEKYLRKAETPNFVLYEQKTNKKVKGGLKNQFETRITAPSPKKKQRPILVTKKTNRPIELPFTTGHYKRLAHLKKITTVKLNQVDPIEYTVEGPTIRDALEGLQFEGTLSKLLSAVSKKILYYTVLIKVVSPEGETTYIPSGGSVVMGFDPKRSDASIIDGELRAMATRAVEDLSHIKAELSRSIIDALGSQGMSFTKLVNLKDVSREQNKKLIKLEKAKAPENIIQNESAILDGLGKRIRKMEGGKLQEINNWKVSIFIKFEIVK